MMDYEESHVCRIYKDASLVSIVRLKCMATHSFLLLLVSCMLIGPTLSLYIFFCRLVPFKIICNCHISSHYVKIIDKITLCCY